MKFNEFSHLTEAQFGSKQEVIDHFVKQGKSAAAGAAAWERGWRGSKPKAKKPTGPVRNYQDDLDDKRYGETNEAKDPCWKNYKRKPGTKKYAPGSCVPKESVEALEAQLAEAAIGTAPKRPARPGSRPERGHTTESRYKYDKKTGQMAHDNEDPDQRHGLYVDGKLVKTVNGHDAAQNLKNRDPRFKDATVKKIAESGIDEGDMIGPIQVCEFCGCHDHTSLDESGKASRSLCTSSKPDADLGASQLSSCKAQGLRARAGEKSHKIGKSRVKVGGHKIKGRKYGGPLPDWS